MRKTNVKISVKKTWISSFLLILIVPVLLSFFIYSFTVRTMNNMINLTSNYYLEMIKQQMDNMINNIRNDCFEIEYNNNFEKIYNKYDSFDEVDPYLVYEIVTSLRKMVAVKGDIESISIYLPKLDAVFGDINAKPKRAFYDTYYYDYDIDYQSWEGLINRQYSPTGEFIGVDLSHEQNKINREIYYVKTSMTQGEHMLNTLIKIDSSIFAQAYQDVKNIRGAELLSINERGSILTSTLSSEMMDEIDLDIFTGKSGTYSLRLGKVDMLVSYITSSVSDYKYLLLVPRSTYWSELDNAKKIMIFSFSVSALLCILLVFAAVKVNYDPVKKLMSSLQSMMRPSVADGSTKGNEYALILQAIGKIQQDQRQIDRQLRYQEKALRNSFLARMIHGNEHWDILSESMDKYNIVLPYMRFAVITIYIQDFSPEYFIPDSGKQPTELDQNRAYDMANFIITNLVEELINQNNIGYAVNVDGMLSFILNLKSDDFDEYRKELRRISETVCNIMRNSFHTELAIAASNIFYTSTGIPIAYEQASSAIEYTQTMGENEIIFYKDTIKIARGGYYYPPDVEQQLIKMIGSKDYDSARMLLHDVIQKNFTKVPLSIDLYKFFALNVVSTFIKALGQFRHGSMEEFVQGTSFVNLFGKCHTGEQVSVLLTEVIERFFNIIMIPPKNESDNEDNAVFQRIMQCVEENYKDFNLSVSSLAAILEMNPIFASKLVRKYTGMGLLDYINKYRIERSKELLASNKMANLADVAAAVGFNNTKTFTRAFKKHGRTTPGKYKNAETTAEA